MDWLPLLAGETTGISTDGVTTSATTTTKDDNPFQPVLDFFDSATFDAILKLVGFMIIVLWLASAFFVFKDARRRIADPVLIAVAVATAIVFPFVGVLIYTILRPPEYLDDVRERELEIRAMERRLGADQRCPYCRSEIEASYLICPVCTSKLKTACRRCKAPLEQHWKVCPYCETEVRSDEPFDTEAPTGVLPRVRRSRQQRASQSP
jgi:RNA polymerase subunit RPABC4/transcription elongation factor Spt4